MTRVAAVLAALTLGLIAGQAQAADVFLNQNCMAETNLRAYLDQAYDEGPVASGILDNGNPVQLFASRAGTWTLIELQPDGVGCVHASGERIRFLPGALEAISLPRARS